MVPNQKSRYVAKTLSTDRITRLERLGFVWDFFAAGWEQMFAELSAYKQAHGDGNVPVQWKENPKLAVWCGRQRAKYKSKELSQDRITRLEQLGFTWDSYNETWEQMFAELTIYKETHGNCNVPNRWADNLDLVSWCSVQRRAYRRKKISLDRLTRLENLGFVWDQLTTSWAEMFAELTAYKQTHGDCNVPRDWAGNPELATWCSTQRKTYKRNKLAADRVKRLEEIGFHFHVRGDQSGQGDLFCEDK